MLCNDEIILLRNISIHQPTCPSCFTWDISGSPEYFQVNEAEGTLLFTYIDDEPLASKLILIIQMYVWKTLL